MSPPGDEQDMVFETLKLRREGAMLTVTLSNPPINLMNEIMIRELFQFAGALAGEQEIRVVVIESADPDFFLAHVDLEHLGETGSDPSKLSRYPDINVIQALVLSWQNLPQVRIAKIDGRARGGGLEFLMAMNMRFASSRSLFGFPEASAAFVPCGGGTSLTTMMAGPARALEIILSSRDFTATEMERYGLINRCLGAEELDTYVDDLARRIAHRSALAVAGVRAVMDGLFQHGVDPLFAGLAAENEAMIAGFASEEMHAMLDAHLAIGQTREHELDLPATIGKIISERRGARSASGHDRP